MDAPIHRSGGCGGLDVPRSSAFVVGTTDDSQDMMMDNIVEAGEHKSDCGVNTTITSDEIGEAMVCARCNMPGSDLRFLPCNCTVHACCFPLSVLSEYTASIGSQPATLSLSRKRPFCHFCQSQSMSATPQNFAPIETIQILSLAFESLEQAGELRYQEQQVSEKSRVNGKRKASGSARAFPTSPPSSDDNLLGLVTADDVDKDKKSLAVAVPFLGIAHHHGGGRTRTSSSPVKSEHRGTSLPSSSTQSYRAANIDHRRRIGRWTAAETAYSDYLVECFEAGTLPLPQGVKLNEFLSDALMCKPSRLTKKMKSAKLSMRSFAFGNWTMDNGSDDTKCNLLSKLEGEFLESINSEHLRLEARFNLERMWRTHFWNLCLQIGFTSLDITEWLPSLEDMELRCAQAEEEVKRAERRRMGLAFKQDSRSSCGLSGVFIGGMPGAAVAAAQSRELIMESPRTEVDQTSNWMSFRTSGGRSRADSMTIPVSKSRSGSINAPTFPNAAGKPTVGSSSIPSLAASTTSQAELEFLNEIFSAEGTGFADPFDANARLEATKNGFTKESAAAVASTADGSSSDMPSLVSMESIQQSQADDNSSSSVDSEIISSGGAYLDVIIKFLEQIKAPFDSAECWVPSFLPSDAYDGTDVCEAKSNNGEVARATAQPRDLQNLRLCYAGHAIRADAVSPSASRNLAAFGEYSSHFSFSPGKGVPGRVYSTNLPSWENDIQCAAPEYFKRVGGAKLYGIRTHAAFPVASPSVGRIVVVLYSTSNVRRDVSLARKIFFELQRHRPEPHWRLVVDVGHVASSSSRAAGLPSSSVPIEQGVKGGPETSPSPMTIDGPDSSSDSAADDDEERDIISLLGDHIPTNNMPGDLLAKGMISLRILLLRPRNKRSDRENELLDITKRSYRSYKSCSVARQRKEIAHLLARDWSFLSPPQEDQNSKPAADKKEAKPIDVPSGAGFGKPAGLASLVTPRSDTQSVQSPKNESKPGTVAVAPLPLPPSSAGSQRTDKINSQSARGNQVTASLSRNDLSLAKGPSSGEHRCRAVSTLSDPSLATTRIPASAKIRLDSFDHSHHGKETVPPPPPPPL